MTVEMVVGDHSHFRASLTMHVTPNVTGTARAAVAVAAADLFPLAGLVTALVPD